MSSAFLFVALFAQSQLTDAFPKHNARAYAVLQRELALSLAPDRESARKAAECQAQRFATTFNRLKKALNEFADTYNQGVLDLKKIEEVKKAWRDLENTEARFRLEKNK
jgi:hypothetical protein